MRQFFCVICDMFNFEKSTLCKRCAAKVFERKTPFLIRYEEKIPHYYLFEWTRQTDTFCRRLAYFLKNKQAFYFDEWVGFFPVELLQNERGETVAAVPPASSQKTVNHAYEMSLSLMKLLGFKRVLEVSLSKDRTSQKKKTRLERLSGMKGVGKRLYLDEDWVFIDDVFVTGGTYNSVRGCFNKAPRAIMTVFYRPLTDRD